jgi:hypothetical protein
MPKKSELTTEGVLLTGLVAAPIGALGGGIFGCLGNSALSFFNPALASTVTGFATFASLGAIALPLMLLPKYLTDHFINNSKFLNRHPHLKGFIQDTTDVLLCLGAVTSAALILGTPLGATVISMMVIPAAIYLLSNLCRVVNALVNATTTNVALDESEEQATLCMQ